MDSPDQTSRPSGDAPFDSMRRRRRSRRLSPAVGVVVLILAAGGIGWWIFRSPDTSEDQATPGFTDTITDVATAERRLELPALDASDAVVRRLVAGVSAHPQIAQWLVNDDLVRRFVSAVVALAGGRSPYADLEFMIPSQGLTAREAAGELVIDPASYARYSTLTTAFLSLDTAGSAALYRQLHPLFEEAYAELGFRDPTWDEAMELAVENVLAAPIPDSPPAVIELEGVYVFADPELEARSPVEKHFYRLGPQNARRIQEKVRELSGAIGL